MARPRSRAGNQRDSARAALGKAPASPAPNRKRIATSEERERAAPVSIVKPDHHSTIRVSTCRGPRVSPSQPEGISNSEYASVNALKTRLIWKTVSCSSSIM